MGCRSCGGSGGFEIPEGMEPADQVLVGPAAPNYYWPPNAEPGSVTSDQAEGKTAKPDAAPEEE